MVFVRARSSAQFGRLSVMGHPWGACDQLTVDDARGQRRDWIAEHEGNARWSQRTIGLALFNRQAGSVDRRPFQVSGTPGTKATDWLTTSIWGGSSGLTNPK